MDIYMEIEEHPSGFWYYITDDYGTEPELLDMAGPYPNELEANNAGEHSLNRQLQSAA